MIRSVNNKDTWYTIPGAKQWIRKNTKATWYEVSIGKTHDIRFRQKVKQHMHAPMSLIAMWIRKKWKNNCNETKRSENCGIAIPQKQNNSVSLIATRQKQNDTTYCDKNETKRLATSRHGEHIKVLNLKIIYTDWSWSWHIHKYAAGTSSYLAAKHVYHAIINRSATYRHRLLFVQWHMELS